MKKTLTIILAMLVVVSLSACSDDAQTTSATAQGSFSEAAGDGQAQPEMNGSQTVGLVTEVLGNEVTIETGEMQGGAMGGGGEMPEGFERGEGGEMPEGSERGEGGEMPEGFERGEGGEMPEGSERGEGGEMPEGFERGEGGEMPEGFERGEGGGMAGGGGMTGEGTDYSELITLTGETETFTIPVGTPVTQFGTEMTFSQIAEDMYIGVFLDDDDNIISVNILG